MNGFDLEVNVSTLTVFIQGLIGFFSPCVLPLLPLYLSYLAGGTAQKDENENTIYPRKKVFINTLFFVIGISITFFLLGLGFTALGAFFNDNRMWFARISGIVMIFFGLYQFGLFGNVAGLSGEHRLKFKVNRFAMGPIPALILGFTFSFAWTPCIGPTLGSVLLLAGSSGSMSTGLVLIGVYALGFIIPFLLVGIFTASLLNFFKKHQKIVKYTAKVGAVLLVFMGIMTLTGFMNNITNYLSTFGAVDTTAQEQSQVESEVSEDEDVILAPDMTLLDQFGNEHTLSDYKGKVVFLNFWATWCPPCQEEMPYIQALYENYGYNEEDVVVLGVAAPNYGQEGSVDHISSFLSDNGYDFPVLMDENSQAFNDYSIRVYPTTFMIDESGAIFGAVQSGLSYDMMESIVEQTIEGVMEE